MAERIPLVYAPSYRQGYYVDNRLYTGNHDRLMQVFEGAGFEPHFYGPNWRDPNPRAWASGMAALAVRVASESDQGVVLAGFSAGGLTAVLATELLLQSSDVKVGGLVGCSVSPWFGLEHVRREHETIPNGDLLSASDVLKDSMSRLELPKIDCPAQLYVGAKEVYTMHMIRDEALKLWSQAESITPSCDEHNVFNSPYLQALSHNAGRLAIMPDC